MKPIHGNLSALMLLLAASTFLAGAGVAYADVSAQTLKSLGAHDKIETSAGTLEFKDGVPTAETAQKVYDTLDFTNALNAYNNSFRGASALGIAKGVEEIGAKPGDVVIFSELMDANSLFLTANADTIYYFTVLDLSKGPIVIEQPSNAVGTINDMWFSWIIDIGGPGPDRGLGGKYLIVGPDYDGPLPEGGYFIGHSKTNFALYAARAYLVDNDPKPAVENVKKEPEGLSLPAGLLRHQCCASSRRHGAYRRRAEDSRDEVHRGQRAVLQYDSAELLRLLRDDQRKRPERACHQL